MPYTLTKGLGWFVAALVLGMVIGWLLRSIAATRQMRKMRAGRVDHTELDRLRARNAILEPAAVERDRFAAELEAPRAPLPAAPDEESHIDLEPDQPEFIELNLVAAAAVIGKKVKLDDLTIIDGIGPPIAALCHNIGIHTWADLAATEASLLRTMLVDAGPRFQMLEPASWPEQAGLLATGQWEAFTTLIASLGSGPASE